MKITTRQLERLRELKNKKDAKPNAFASHLLKHWNPVFYLMIYALALIVFFESQGYRELAFLSGGVFIGMLWRDKSYLDYYNSFLEITHYIIDWGKVENLINENTMEEK